MSSKRILSVEGLRGLASVCVAWFHLTHHYQWGFVRWSGSSGALGVEAFFVISGFVIPYSLWMSDYKLNNFARYLIRRVVRIEPPYLISIFLALLLWKLATFAPGFAGSAPVYSTQQILFHFFYLIPFTNYEWFSPVYWSLAYEFVFYIVIGLLYGFFVSRHIAWCLALAFGIFAFTRNAFAFLFLIGMASMRYKVGIDRLSVGVAVSLLAGGALAYHGVPDIAIVGLGTAAIIVFVNLNKLTPPLAFLGTISYSLYLTHVAIGGRVVSLGMRFGNSELYELLLSLVALSISILFAWLFYLLIEKRATQFAALVSYRENPNAVALSCSSSDAPRGLINQDSTHDDAGA